MRTVPRKTGQLALIAAVIHVASLCPCDAESVRQGVIEAAPPPHAAQHITIPRTPLRIAQSTSSEDPQPSQTASDVEEAPEGEQETPAGTDEQEQTPTSESNEPASDESTDTPDDAPGDPSVPVEGEQPPAAVEQGAQSGASENGKDEAEGEEDWRPAPSEEHILVDADEVYYHSGATVAEGNVVVRYRDITVTSDTAEIDEDGVWGQFRGNVEIEQRGQVTAADLIRMNFETEQWEVLGARTRFEPEQFERGVEEPIFVRAQTISGTGEERKVDAFDGLATSCDLEEPHYGMHSEHIRVVGDDRVVLERPRLEILGNTVFQYPWDLVLSQQSRNNRFFPEFGQNTVEGFYAKLAYLYITGSELNSYVRLHLTEKRGIGFGGDHYFRTGRHSGEASAFFQPEEGSMSARLRHEWDISSELSSRFNLSLQENSGYQSASRSLSGSLNLDYRAEDYTTRLGIDRSVTDTTYSSSKRFTSALTHRHRLPGNASWDLRSTLRRSDYGSDRPVSETIEADFQYQDRNDWFDWALQAEKEWQTSGEDTDSYRLEKLPEIVFNTDTRRLGDWKLPGGIPFRSKLTAGHLVQYPDEEEISTAVIELDLGGERNEVTDNTTMTTSVNFDQSFFSEGSALYTVGGSLSINTEYGSNWYSRISHRAATVAGFSPLRRSYGGVFDYTTLSVVQQYPDASRFELTGGFDYVRDRWRELRLRGYYNATERDRLELTSGFSLNDSTWRPLQLRWTHATPWQIYLALSSTYDLDDGSLNSSDLEFDWRIDDKWQLAGLGTYSGYRDSLEDFSLRLTRDLHCWIGTLTYDSDYDELRLNLGIKAFPFEAQDWTVGRGGARQGSFQQYYY